MFILFRIRIFGDELNLKHDPFDPYPYQEGTKMIQNDFLHLYMSHLDPPNLYLWSQKHRQKSRKSY